MFNFGWLLSAMSLFVLAETTAKERDFSIWEPEMQAFDALDAEKAPATGGVLFVGSSSIRMWDLSKVLPRARFHQSRFWWIPCHRFHPLCRSNHSQASPSHRYFLRRRQRHR